MDRKLLVELQNIVIQLHYLASSASIRSLAIRLREIADELSDLVEHKLKPEVLSSTDENTRLRT